jgi:peptidoglycan/xylan/chitin deacetylase (PgdA/CDA1 family)
VADIVTTPDPQISRRTLLTGAAVGVGAVVAAGSGRATTRVARSARPIGAATSAATSIATASSTPPPDPASVAANELGAIPVLMHHRLVERVESEFDMTPAWFRAELERLHREGYFPVTMLQVARRDLGHVPAGKAPVVLTFDDSSRGQLHYASGRVAHDSAVGMLVDFAREHTDFPAVASFYLNKDPFALGDPHRAVTDLHRLGMEVGNHTYDHVPLDIAPAKVQQQIGELSAMVSAAVPGLATKTIALPLGVEPSHPALVRAGRWRSTSYANEAVLLVGAEPAHSPFHRLWKPSAVPRIRSSSFAGGRGEFMSMWWLDRLASGAVTRYVSAGNPGHVSFPKKYADRLAPRFRSAAVAY